MSPEQFTKLRELTERFESGKAGHDEIKQLSEILSNHDRHIDITDKLSNSNTPNFKIR